MFGHCVVRGAMVLQASFSHFLFSRIRHCCCISSGCQGHLATPTLGIRESVSACIFWPTNRSINANNFNVFNVCAHGKGCRRLPKKCPLKVERSPSRTALGTSKCVHHRCMCRGLHRLRLFDRASAAQIYGASAGKIWQPGLFKQTLVRWHTTHIHINSSMLFVMALVP